VVLLLNTYPLLVSEDLVFHSKVSTMQSSVWVMVSALSGLDELTEENVADAMTVAEETGLSRILVTDETGRILYDSRETDGAVNGYALYTEVVQALEGNDASCCSYQNGAFRSRAASPVLYQNQIIGAVYAYEYDTEQAVLLEGFQSNLLRISLMVGALVIVLSVLLSHALTSRIGELLRAIVLVRDGAYDHRAAVRGKDEIAQLSEAFNSMTDRLEQTEELRRRFVSDASHELKTPLAAIRLLTDSILQTEHMDPETTREFVADIGQEADRLSRITEDLLRLTRLDSGLPAAETPAEVEPVFAQVLRMMELVAKEKQVELICARSEACRVLATDDQLYQVIYNLVDNAVKYTPSGGRVETALYREGDQVILTVADNGIGIPEEDLPRVFERFYRVDKARSRAAGGTGLGLSIVRDTVRRQGGSVTAENRPGGGALFTVIWPEAREGGQTE
jgi:signal transduction histidine kinase